MKPARTFARRLAPSALLAFVALISAPANADSFFFNTASGSWENQSNWDAQTNSGPPNFNSIYYPANAVPTGNDYAIIRSGRTATISSSGSAFIVRVGDYDENNTPTSGTLNITGGSLLVYDTAIEHGGTINVSGGSLFSSDPFTNANSSIHIGNGSVNLTGTGLVQVGLNGVGTVYMQPSSATATLNIGTGGTAGTLNAARVTGTSSAVVNFNHTGDVTLDSRLTGQLSVTKSGSGTTTLTGATTYDSATGNTYSGGTTINAGTLRTDGGFSGALGTGAVAVNDGGTLAGNDSVSGLTTVKEGGHLAPDAGGLLRFDAGLTLEDGAVLDLSLGGGPPFSILIYESAFNADGVITVNLSDSGTFTAGTFTLIDFSLATEVNNTATFQLGTQIAGFTTVLSYDGNALVATATVSAAVPEPSTYAALAGCGTLVSVLLLRRRRA